MKTTLKIICLAAPVSLFFSGCERSEPVMHPTAGVDDGVTRTVKAIAVARCDRAKRCNQIGSAKSYASRQHCMNSAEKETWESLGECASGIDQEDARECVAEINNQDCAGPTDKLEQLKECKVDDLCDGAAVSP